MLNNAPLPLDLPFKDAEGNSYPANWLRLTSMEEKAAIGITEVPDPEPAPIVVTPPAEEPAPAQEQVQEPAPQQGVTE